MKVEDVATAVNLNKKIKEWQKRIIRIEQSAVLEFSGLTADGSYLFSCMQLPEPQIAAIKTTTIAVLEEQIKAAMAELEKL